MPSQSTVAATSKTAAVAIGAHIDEGIPRCPMELTGINFLISRNRTNTMYTATRALGTAITTACSFGPLPNSTATSGSRITLTAV